MSPGGTGMICDACASGLPGASALAREVRNRPPNDSRRLYLLQFGVEHLVESQRWDELEATLTDMFYLEAKVEAGLAFELIDDYAEAMRHLPVSRPVRRILGLLDEALRRDLYFIIRHPQTLFQCLWNSGWWYDGPRAAQHYDPPAEGWSPNGPPWTHGLRLALLLESWRRAREQTPNFTWLRSLRPPTFPLDSPQRAVIPVETDRLRFLNLAFAPDSPVLFAWLCPVGAAGLGNRLLRTWDARTGREVDHVSQYIPPHDPTVSPDGRWRVEYGGPEGG